MRYHYHQLVQCGCWYVLPNHIHQKRYLPQVELESTTTILSCTARTKLVQTFTNTENSAIPEAQYTFPLYDGVSVVSFKCKIGDRTIYGMVKEKQQARDDYKKAIDRGETAGLLEQFQEAGDIFTTKIGNIPAAAKVVVEIVYLGELKHDAEKDGARFTIPTQIAPRYGTYSTDSQSKMFGLSNVPEPKGIKIVVDVAVEEGSAIRGLQSPSHPIAVTLGRNSLHDEDVFQSNLASATLALSGKTELASDFVIIVNAQGQDTPRALFETHDALQNQRALMTTVVPKFNLPNSNPEIMFMVDRSGSMEGQIPLVVKALRVFLKSLPMSAKFNICSFGSHHSFLFKKSKPYDESSLNEASVHLNSFAADYGGTVILEAMKEVVKQRLNKKTPLEIMLLTDGDIWQQQELFDFVNSVASSNVRVFSLGIGSGASTSLVEGLARAGNGFAQFVNDGEQIDKRVVRMLKAAMMPFIRDYSLEVVYGPEDGDEDADGFTLVESFTESMKLVDKDLESGKSAEQSAQKTGQSSVKKVISLFSQNFKETNIVDEKAGRYDHLPSIPIPKVLQAPSRIPQLYPFNRTTIYLLFGPDSCQRCPQKVVLRGTSDHGPLELEIPVQDIGKGEMVHQLAAKKAIQDLEEGRGWLVQDTTSKNRWVDKYAGDWDRIVERESVRLGTRFQIAGKYCSFVAVEHKDDNDDDAMDVIETTEKNKPAMSASAPSRFPQRQKAQDNESYGTTELQTSEMEADDSAMRAPSHKKKALFGSGVQYRKRSSASAPGGRDRLAFGAAPAKESRISGGALFGGSSHASPPPPPQYSMPLTAGYAPPASAPRAPMRRMAPTAALAPPPPGAAYNVSTPPISDELLKQYRSEMDSAACMPIADEDEADLDIDTTVKDGTGSQDPASAMYTVIGLQEFNGSWKKIAELLAVTNVDQKSFDSALDSVTSDIVKATILAVAWFEVTASSEKETWEMVVDKAKAWISSQGHVDVDSLVKSAKEAFFP